MATGDPPRTVDFGHLERYALADQSLVDEVLAIFQQQAEVWGKQFDPAAPDKAWRDLAHSLKGSALGIGAFALADECEAAERSTRTDLEERERLLAYIHQALAAALAEIAVYLQDRAARKSRA